MCSHNFYMRGRVVEGVDDSKAKESELKIERIYF